MPPPPDALSGLADHLLVERVVAMDADAFEVLYDRHLSSAFGLAYRIVGSPGPANEVCQEAFLAVWRSARTFDARVGSVRSWLLTIVRNRAIEACGAGREYQVWIRSGQGDPRPTSVLFDVGPDGRGHAAIPAQAMEGTDEVLLTSEPDGGSPAPTRDPVLQVVMPA